MIPTNLAKDTYISAIDFRPGNAKVVHHIEAFVDVTGDARKRDEAEPGPGYISFSGAGIPQSEELSFWTAGHVPHHLPDRHRPAPAPRSDLILQVHYHATGKPEVDRTRVGVYFSREPVRQALHWNTASNSEFKIPAGHDNVEVRPAGSSPRPSKPWPSRRTCTCWARTCGSRRTLPNGRTAGPDPHPRVGPLLAELVLLPEADRPARRARSSRWSPTSTTPGTPATPTTPPSASKYGTGTHDEMCEGFIAVVKKGQDLTRPGSRDDLAEIFERQRVRSQVKQQQAKSAR